MLHAHNIILRYWYAQFEWLVLKHDQCTWAGGFMLSIHCSPPLLSILCRLVAARPEVRSHWRKERSPSGDIPLKGNRANVGKHGWKLHRTEYGFDRVVRGTVPFPSSFLHGEYVLWQDAPLLLCSVVRLRFACILISKSLQFAKKIP